MITTLREQVATLTPDLQQAFERIFYVNHTTGYTDPPETMYDWIERQFGSVEQVRAQAVVKVYNRLTLEAAIFNPLRALRPMAHGSGDGALEEHISAALAGRDHFREPLRDTTADLFGRIRGRYSSSASNVAKIDGWHGLVLFDEPHPLRFNREQLRDYLEVAFRWMGEAHQHDSSAVYPIVIWHCLPKASASQMHGHMQLGLASGMHYARVELWRRAAQEYRARYRASYVEALVTLHEALGLRLPTVDNVHAFVHLTPLRPREVVLLVEPPARRTTGQPHWTPAELLARSETVADALYDVLRGLIDRQGMRAFNVAITPPPLGPAAEDWSEFPLVVRLGDRGDPLTSCNDVGAMELYAMGCIADDPFVVAAGLR